MREIRTSVIGIAIALAAIGVAACDGDDEPGSPTPTATVTATAEPTSTATEAPATATPSLEEEVSAAYLAYIDAYAEAVLHLNVALVEEFVGGAELELIRDEIETMRVDGVALRVVVDHDFAVVEVAEGSALIADEMVDNSFYVDAATLEPAEAEGSGEVHRDLVRLERVDGRWLVTGATRDRGD